MSGASSAQYHPNHNIIYARESCIPYRALVHPHPLHRILYLSAPVNLFSSSHSKGVLRPYTAPECLSQGQFNSNGNGIGIDNVSRRRNHRPASDKTDTAPTPPEWEPVDRRGRRSSSGAIGGFSTSQLRGSSAADSSKNYQADRGRTANRRTDAKAVNDDFRPRTQILGMNAGRLPREVRQASLHRPLTAPCVKAGQWKVVRGYGNRGLSQIS